MTDKPPHHGSQDCLATTPDTGFGTRLDGWFDGITIAIHFVFNMKTPMPVALFITRNIWRLPSVGGRLGCVVPG